ncbi:hypothetical protein Tco_0201253 [Tanacetum coccineum]
MSSESTSSGTPRCLLTPSSKVKFQHHESIIAYNNVVALLEHHEPLFKPMLSFLSNCSICTALTKEPSAMYVEYLKDFWYTAKVDDATKDISFSLSLFENQLSFTRFDFLTAIGLTDSKTVMPLPPKGTIKAGLATLASSFQTPSVSEVSLTSHMLKVAKLSKEPDEYLILPSKEVNAKESPDKSQSGTNVQPLSLIPKHQLLRNLRRRKPHLQLNQRLSHPCMKVDLCKNYTHSDSEVPEKIVEKEEVAEEQTLEIPSLEQLEEVDNHNQAVQTTLESPYDTESEIKVVKSFLTSHLSELHDQTMNDYEVSADIQDNSDSDIHSMPDDELRSVSEFKTVDSDDGHDNDVSTSDHVVQDDYASAERLSLPDHMDHICEEVSSLHSRLEDLESYIAQKVSDEIQSSLPSLVTNALKEQLPGILSATLKDCLLLIVKESLQTHISAASEQFAETQTQLNKKVGELAYNESTLPVSETKVNKESAMILYNPEKKDLVDLTTTEQDSEDDNYLDKQPLSNRLKIMHPIPSKPQPSVKQFTDQLFRTTSLNFSPTPLREPTPPRDESKGKGIATEEPPKDIMLFIEEGGSVPNMPNLKSFVLPEGTLSQEKFMAQLKEMKILVDLKEQEKKSEEELKKLLNPATLKTPSLKWEEHKEKKAKLLKKFNKCISERTSPLPITKISYVVNSSKTATMRITRDKDPLNLKVYPDFRLRMLGFSEWLEVHALASKKKRKRKRTEFLKEMFVTEDIRVDEMNRNLIPPPELIRIQNQIKVDSEIASEMYRTMNYVIEARDDCIEARKIVQENLDNLG